MMAEENLELMNGPCPGDGRTGQSSESVVSFDMRFT